MKYVLPKVLLSASLLLGIAGLNIYRNNPPYTPPAPIVRESSYQQLRTNLEEAGYSIDPIHSKEVDGARQVVIHLQDIHGLYNAEELAAVRTQTFTNLDGLLQEFPIDSVGLEGFSGAVTPAVHNSLAEHAAAQNALLNTLHPELVEQRDRCKRLVEGLALPLGNYGEALDAIATAVLNVDNTTVPLAPYATHLRNADIPLFGIEDTPTHTYAVMQARGFLCVAGAQNAQTLLEYLADESEQYLGNPLFTELYQRIESWQNTLLDCALGNGLPWDAISQVSAVEETLHERRILWPESLTYQGNLILTIAGAANTSGYIAALHEEGISTIVLEAPELQ